MTQCTVYVVTGPQVPEGGGGSQVEHGRGENQTAHPGAPAGEGAAPHGDAERVHHLGHLAEGHAAHRAHQEPGQDELASVSGVQCQSAVNILLIVWIFKCAL